MSVLFSAIAWATKVSPAARKIVLLKLADNANDKGLCWPSYDHLAAHCGMSKRSVQRHIDALEQSGFLERKRRYGGPNNNMTNVFKLTLKMDVINAPNDHKKTDKSDKNNPEYPAKSTDLGGVNLSRSKAEGCQPCQGGATPLSGRGDTTVTLNHQGTVKEPSLNIYVKKPEFIREIFDHYPAHRRGGNDAQLFKVFKSEKLTATDAQNIIIWLNQAAQSDPQWATDAGGQFVNGLTKFIRERIWLTPLPTGKSTAANTPSSAPDFQSNDTDWANDLGL